MASLLPSTALTCRVRAHQRASTGIYGRATLVGGWSELSADSVVRPQGPANNSIRAFRTLGTPRHTPLLYFGGLFRNAHTHAYAPARTKFLLCEDVSLTLADPFCV